MNVKALAKRMATAAHLLRDMIGQEIRARESGEQGYVWGALMETLKLDGEAVADLWAQVVCYGVFLASVWGTGEVDFFRRSLRDAWTGVRGNGRMTDVLEALRWELCEGEFAHIVQAFVQPGTPAGSVVHVYELFLEEYDATIRERRGVYYTPAPVVAYIVKSVDELLVSRFEVADGLADTQQVHVIDPAVGTGAFLQGVIDRVERRVKESAVHWEAYVREQLLTRLHGVEVMPAPQTIAHLLLEARLAESGVQLVPGERLDLRVGNSLEAELQKELLSSAGLANEDAPVLVVLGNPPYANFGQMNSNPWIEELLQTYKTGLQERKTNLHDDYIKFIRLAQWQVEQAGLGVVAFVTNHSFLGGLTHRRMRESLLQSFDEIFVLNLHGDFSERHAWPDDENVFDITRGVAITVMVRTKQIRDPLCKAQVYYRDITGSREEKFAFLQTNSLASTAWERLTPTEGSFPFLPQSGRFAEEYAGYWSLPDIFTVCHSGIQTKRDKLAIHFAEASLADVLEQMRGVKNEAELEAWRAERDLGADSNGWRLQAAVDDVRLADGVVIDVQYRPFDLRKTYFTGRSNGFLGRPRAEVTRHFLQPNLALASMRQLAGIPDRCAVLATRHMLTDRAMYSRNGTPYVFPLYSYRQSPLGQERVHNLNREFVAALEKTTGMRFDENGRADEQQEGHVQEWAFVDGEKDFCGCNEVSVETDSFDPEDVFAYVYAVLHAESYRERYAEFLKTDFPRVPANAGREAFTEWVRLGKRLVRLHTGEENLAPRVHFHASGNDLIQKPRYEPESQRLYINPMQFLAPVTPDMWHYRVGGYQVAAQWLKERRGRKLGAEEVHHFRRLLTMLANASDVIREIGCLNLE